LTELDLANRVAQELTLSFVDHQQAGARGVQSVIWFTLRNQAQADDWHGLTLLAGQRPAANAAPATEGQVTLGYLAYQRWIQELTGTRLLRNESQPTWNTGNIPVPEGARPCYPPNDPRAQQVPAFCDTLQRYVFTTPRGVGEKWVVWIDAGTFVNAVPSKTTATRTLVLPRQPVAVRDVVGAPVPVIPNPAGQPTVVVSESPIYITFG
ncbi:MAG: hypothetical protein NZ518_11760, partial [Dehalococcoidia bacterium]|nr:hypothetical protein [Dehalococcoidia bacterium]